MSHDAPTTTGPAPGGSAGGAHPSVLANASFVPTVDKPTFTGELSPTETLQAITSLKHYFQYLLDKGMAADRALAHLVTECLKGTAATWWMTIGRAASYDAFEQQLLDRFVHPADRLSVARTLIYESRQGLSSIQRYHDNFVKALEALRVMRFDWATHGPKVVFLNGLNDACKGPMATAHDVEDMTIGQIAQRIKNVELTGKLAGRDMTVRNLIGRFPRPASPAANPTFHSSSGNGYGNAPNAARGQRPAPAVRSDGRPDGRGRDAAKRAPRDLSTITCNRCGERGHIAAQCSADAATMLAYRGKR
jgi:hypothetical protein